MKKVLQENSQVIFFSLVVLNVLTVLFYVYSLIGRVPHIDSALLAEPVYWLGHDGVVSAVAIGFHLNGVILICSAFCFLLYQKRFMQSLVFGAVASLGLLFHLLGVESKSDLLLMLHQFSSMQDITPEHGTISKYFMNIILEYKRYFHGLREISASLCLLGVFLYYRKQLVRVFRQNLLVRNETVFLIIFMFFLALIAHGKTAKYLVLISTCLFFFCRHFFIYFPPMKRGYVVALFVIFAVGQFPKNYHFATQKYSLQGFAQSLKENEINFSRDSKIHGPSELTFELTPVVKFQGYFSYQIPLSRGEVSNHLEDFENFLTKNSQDIVIVDKGMKHEFKMHENSFQCYEFVYTWSGYDIFRFKC